MLSSGLGPAARGAKRGARFRAGACPWAQRLAQVRRAAAILFVALWAMAASAAAAEDLAALCDRAASAAAAETGVPLSVLKAIALVETGRVSDGAVRPWPWTVNMEGKGLWFDSADAARAYVYEHYRRGARSFDVGCFQINYRWHHEAFASIDEMFDPMINARYAARFLRDLYAEKGDWVAAAGAYHSRTPEHADSYAARFAAYRARLEGEDVLPLRVAGDMQGPGTGDTPYLAGPDAALPGTTRLRVNSYPLLQAGGDAAIGSLVPLGTPGGSSLFARGGAGQGGA